VNNAGVFTALEAQPALDESNIVCDQAGMPEYDWARDATIINKIDVRFDYNEVDLVEGDFARRQVYAANLSRDRFNTQPIQPFELRGVHTDLGADAITDNLALILMQRFGYSPPLLKASATYQTHTIQQGDRIPVSHPLMRNPVTGKLGLDRERFEVLNVSPSWLTEGKVEYELLWVGAIESSPVPTKTLSNLVPGLTSIDGTDVPIPLSGSVVITTAPAVSKFRIGLKALAYRIWMCSFDVQQNYNIGGVPPVFECRSTGGTTLRQSFRGSWTYRMEYKVTTAADTTGTADDPTTGWVSLLASKTIGSVSLWAGGGCGAGVNPSTPAEEFFSEFFDEPAAAPNTYDVKIFWTAVGQAATPCPSLDPTMCDPDIFCPGGVLTGSTLLSDVSTFTADYLESIT
jgi:hypothetical protein